MYTEPAIEYISAEKAHLHLKLGRKLAVFVKVGTWFEHKTFEWICIEGKSVPHTANYITAFDMGDEYDNDVSEFSTANEYDNDTDQQENRFTGSLEDCMHWISDKLETNNIHLMKPEDLKTIYRDLTIRKKLLGRI